VPDLEVKVVDECDDSRGARGALHVLVSPFGRVSKERGITQGVYLFLMPLPWVPWEVFDDARLKDPVCFVSLVGKWRVVGDFERRSMSLARQDPDQG